jgi:hypothetical protein
LHPQCREQIEIVSQIEEAPVRDEITAKGDDKNLAPKSIDIGRNRLEPVNETVLTRKTLAANRLRRLAWTVSLRFLFFAVRNGTLLDRAARRD